MNHSFRFLLSVLMVSISLISCKQEAGEGGKARISGKVLHHEAAIPFASVFIQYGTSEFPGASASLYQDSVKTNEAGQFVFEGLKKGKYYLYCTGYDGAWTPPSVVFGGIPAEIYQRREDVQVNIPVSE